MSSEVAEKQKELPEFTLHNVLGDIKNAIHYLLYDPFYKRLVGPILIFLTSFFTKIIIAKVPYTEIDFKTYMQQIQIANDGALDYSLITGDTGPAVYPAGFITVYQWIAWLSKDGEDIAAAQTLFSYLFTLSTAGTMICYSMVENFPPWPLFFLLASKRLVSIYVLRLFNDCFTTAAMVGVTLCLQAAAYFYSSMGPTLTFLLTLVAADLYSLAISVKMNALLYLPAFIIIIYFLNGENLLKSLAVLVVIPAVQVLVGWKYLLPMFNDEEAQYLRWTYLNQAFNFGRKFLYKWTVNWRFIPEEVFLSDSFSNALLVGHVTVLLLFVFTIFISSHTTKKSLAQLIQDALLRPLSSTVHNGNLYLAPTKGPKLILLALSTTNLIGVLFSRSLHYQFLCWYCWQLPFLLYSTGWGLGISIPVWVAHEYCWNTFPATPLSSAILVTVLGSILLGVWHRQCI